MSAKDTLFDELVAAGKIITTDDDPAVTLARMVVNFKGSDAERKLLHKLLGDELIRSARRTAEIFINQRSC